MINLRYHVVSLVAVFLALGMGIVMGSTVIDRVTVDALNNNLERVRTDVNQTREENRRLAEQAQDGQEFADQSLNHVLRDQLSGVPVIVVAVSGIDRKPVDALRQSLLERRGVAPGDDLGHQQDATRRRGRGQCPGRHPLLVHLRLHDDNRRRSHHPHHQRRRPAPTPSAGRPWPS